MSDTFGDIGSSTDLSDFFDSGSSGGGADLSGAFNNLDPNAFNGSDLGSLASQAMGGLGSIFGGGAGGGAVQQANNTSAINQVADPANTAQTDLNAGQPAPTNAQSQSQQGGGQGSQNANQFAPQSAVDQLKKALQGLKQQQRQNPYQTGDGAGAAAAGQNSTMLNRAARIPTGQAAPMPPQPAQPQDQDQGPLGSSVTMNAMQSQPGAGGFDPTAVMGDEGPTPGDPTPKPNWWKWAGGRPFLPSEGGGVGATGLGGGVGATGLNLDPNAVTDIPDFRRNPAAVQAGQGAVEGATAPPSEPSSLPPNLGGGPSAAGTLSGLARSIFPSLPSSLLGAAGTYFSNTSPAETGELPYGGYKGDTKSFKPPDYRPEDDPSVTKAPDTGKPVQAVDPKTKKPVDPKTGDPVKPHHKGMSPAGGPWVTVHGKDYQTDKDGNIVGNPLPTKKPHPDQTAPAPQPGPGRMQQDMTGGQGIPAVLGDLARIALPMILQGLMGGGRRGGFRMGRGWGHPFGFGGRNMGPGFGGRRGWPFYHPTFGWQIHGQHPGRGWLPMDPSHMRQFMGGGGGGGPLGYAGGDGQDGGGQDGTPPSYDPRYDKMSRYRQQQPPSSSVIGKGPDGQALPFTGEQVANFTDQVAGGLGIDPKIARQILAGESAYGQNYTNPNDTDGYPSFGPFQLHMKPGAMGWRFQQATGENPRDPSTWKDQIVFALREAAKHGWGQWGAARDHGIPLMAGIPRGGGKNFAWNYGKENGGVTATGGSNKPNPDGNAPATTQQGPEGMAMAQ